MEDGVAEPELEDHLRQVLVRGLQPIRVELVEPNPAWPARYLRYAATLRDVLGERLRLLEHIGSTSVPRLTAKPVIDIVAGLDDPDDEPAYLPDLETAGWDLRVREPGHRCLRGGDPEVPANLHCYRPDDPEVDRYLRFRERLRGDDADRERYANAKRALAGREWPDMNFYAEAKSSVIAEILGRS
jgi:GrpB-like predicted nucleotidyltransferase (UPF0157 family)